jgi:TonB family protein
VETDCDRRVLATAPDVRRYGTLLLEVAERTRRHALPMAAFAESRSSLERRIRMMTNRQARNRVGWALAVGLSVAAAPAALLALPAPAPVGVEGVRGAVTDWVRAQQPEQVHRVTVSAAQLHDRLLLLMPPDPNAHRDTVPAGQSHAYQVRELDVKPRLLNPPEIQALLTHLYPPELQVARVGGTAVVQFVVAVDGTVDPSTIKTISSTDPRFAEASAAAVRAFRFQPGLLNGKKVRALIQMPVTWQPDAGTSTPAVDPADFSGMGVARGVDAGAPPRDSAKFEYEVARLDTKPELLNTQEIADLMNRFYPRGLREAGIGGPAVVEFVIQADGSVDPTTLRLIGNPNRQLGTASILVAERFRFRPGMRNGKPVRVLIQMPITWQPEASGAGTKGFQELIPPKESPPAVPDVDTGAPAVNPADFRVVGEGDTHARITGFILDRDDHPVVGANVNIPALQRGAVTQSDGRFTIVVPPGTHRLQVSAPGWPKSVSMEVRALAGRTAVVGFSEPAP